MQQLHIVTGAFGYSGKYIAARLLKEGVRVRTLTNSTNRANPFGDQVEARPFDFDNVDKLAESMRGAAVLYNTYWVRFNHPRFKFADAVKNTLKLFDAAKRAGVERVVHVSITNPSEDSPLEYFSGKARLERALIESGLSHAILRPTVLFGKEDILVNNISWTLRHLPVFGVFGDGQYKLQPIYVDDLAALAVEQGKGARIELSTRLVLKHLRTAISCVRSVRSSARGDRLSRSRRGLVTRSARSSAARKAMCSSRVRRLTA